MEILQTIWTALTTENELLTRIILIPDTFLEVFLAMLIFTNLLGLSAKNKHKIYYTLIVSISANVTNLFVPNPYKFFINIFVMILSLYIIFKPNILKLMLAFITPLLITALCESIITKVYSEVLDFNSLSLLNTPLYRLGITLGIQFLVFIVYLFIKYYKINLSLIENMSKKGKQILIINQIVAIISIIIQFWITGFYLNRLPLYIVIFSNITLIAYFLLNIYSLTKTTQLEVTALNLEQEKEHNARLKELQDDLQGFRHDFSNILCTISGYIQVNDMAGLKKYYSEIQPDITKVNTLGSLNPEIINNPAIFILISSKYSKALKENIEMNINIFLDLNTLNMKIYEFTRILGILLDNSIEATKECNEKIINLEIRKDYNKNRQLLIIENTYQNKNIDIDKIFEKNYSTKTGNTGLGLWEVRQILKRNKNLNLFTSKTDSFFKQQLEIYNI